MQTYYGLEELDGRIWNKVDDILRAATSWDAHNLAKKAKDSALIHCLSMWSKGRARGPATPENFEKKAKQAESLAEFHDKKGNGETAKKQIQRAEALRKEADKLRTQPT